MALKDYVYYKEALDRAYDFGLIGIEVEIVQLPRKENGNQAIVKATAEFENINPKTGEKREGKRTFTEVGDADPSNVSQSIAKHILRMAATRGKGRALRDGINLGEALAEEMGGDVLTGLADHDHISEGTQQAILEAATRLYPDEGITRLTHIINSKRSPTDSPWRLDKITETEGEKLLHWIEKQI